MVGVDVVAPQDLQQQGVHHLGGFGLPPEVAAGVRHEHEVAGLLDGVAHAERSVKGQSAAAAEIDDQRKRLIAAVVERNVNHVGRA